MDLFINMDLDNRNLESMNINMDLETSINKN